MEDLELSEIQKNQFINVSYELRLARTKSVSPTWEEQITIVAL